MAGNLPDPAASLTSARKAAAALTVLAGAMVAAMAGWNAVRGWMQVTEASGPQAATLLNSRELGGIALPNWNGEWLMLVLGGFGLWLGGLTMASAPRQRRLGTWLLLIVGVAGALLAAEMLQVGVTSPEARLRLLGWLSLPKLATTKVAMIAMIILGLGLATHGSGSSASTTSIGPFHTTKFLLVLLQLSGLLLVVQTFSIENEVFHGRLMPLILAGFAIHAVLPPDLRATFFLLLSLGSILGVFGATDGGILVGLGLVLIGVCHLPIAFWYRLIILLGLVGALVALRAGLASVAWSQAIWPVLG
ncbi:MAG: hypothetical protein GWN58_48145, partial [Anaerolineae bacterium]|nr:hypothetical protein [Anaerolineae bacterium]